MDATVEWKAVARPVRNKCQTPDLVCRADVENEVNDERIYISDLLQQLLKNGSEIRKKISTKSTTAKVLSPLHLAEKLHLIEYFDDIRLLNKRSECINHWRYQKKLLLESLKRNDSMVRH